MANRHFGAIFTRRLTAFGRILTLVLALLLLTVAPGWPQDVQERGQKEPIAETSASEEVSPRFDINGYEIEGSTLLPVESIAEALRDHVGPGKTAKDVERARDALEKCHREAGYPTVLVLIPEQKVAEGIINLEVIESKINKVKVSGNRFFTMERIKKSLSSLGTGEVLHEPTVLKEVSMLNRNQDIKVKVAPSPGREPGNVDIELAVEDKRPIHGYVELNNRSSHDTTDLRLNALISYDNLWQRQHSVSFQYQTSPQDIEEVQVFAGSYSLPAPWFSDHYIVIYGILSDSNTAFGEGFQTVGKGSIIGARYIMPLPSYKRYGHSINIGMDYKDFQELTDQSAESASEPSSIKYLPLSIGYSATLEDPWGLSVFSASLRAAFRGLVTDQREFEEKRYRARGNYLAGTLGVERLQQLPWDFGLFLKVNGQVADQPLINNEQYAAGGMESVRGYMETEALGDIAIHTVVELRGPQLTEFVGLKDKFTCTPFAFYDFASLEILDPLPEQVAFQDLQGTGAGFRGSFMKHFEYNTIYGVTLVDSDKTKAGTSRFYFKVRYAF